MLTANVAQAQRGTICEAIAGAIQYAKRNAQIKASRYRGTPYFYTQEQP